MGDTFPWPLIAVLVLFLVFTAVTAKAEERERVGSGRMIEPTTSVSGATTRQYADPASRPALAVELAPDPLVLELTGREVWRGGLAPPFQHFWVDAAELRSGFWKGYVTWQPGTWSTAADGATRQEVLDRLFLELARVFPGGRRSERCP